jgi:hypothetical protein
LTAPAPGEAHMPPVARKSRDFPKFGPFRGGAGGALLLALVSGLADADGASPPPAANPEAEAAWREVQRLESGPGAEPKGDPKETYGRHVLAQEKALRRFLELAGEGGDRRFDARFRLARVLALRAEIEANNSLQEESDAILEAIEKGASSVQQSHIAFTRIAQWMRRNRFPSPEQRRELLGAAREFRDRYPNDIRAARLLVEVATQFDREPDVKRGILSDALRLTKDPELTQRIADETRKLGLLGKALELSFSDVGGRPFRLDQMRGRPVVLLYFSEASPPSLAAWRTLNEGLAGYPDVGRVAVSLDGTRASMDRARQGLGTGWTIGWDGLGWGSPLARRWGINALPTVWLIDARGKLSSLNAMEGLSEQLRAASSKTQNTNR